MNRSGHEQANFFVGTEVEHTPALDKHTLFVVGVQPVEQICWQIGEVSQHSKMPITHIYFGANQSFPNPEVNNADTWDQWETMIQALLDKGFWCTLDLDVKAVAGLCEGGLCDNAQFIPMISVKLPYVKLLGYNATVKLDDQDFAATNPGVWCHSLHDLMDRKHFTGWYQYTNDKVIK
jgi:hypothetical protein